MTFSELLKSFFLGLIQGLSEFLPISSSGHLVLTGSIFHISHLDLFFILVLHLGSLMSIFSFYYSDILLILKQFKKPFSLSRHNRLIYLVLVATLPSVPGALLLSPLVEKSLTQIHWTGVGFLLTAFCLFFTRWPLKKTETVSQKEDFSYLKKHTPIPFAESTYLSFQKALIIGLFQILAFFPGMSRSGWTISAGIFLGLPKTQAVFFSFLLAIPAIFGALAFQLIQQGGSFLLKDIPILYLTIAFFSSWLFGYLALKWVVRSIQNLSFPIFAFYLWPLGLIIIMKDLL